LPRARAPVPRPPVPLPAAVRPAIVRPGRALRGSRVGGCDAVVGWITASRAGECPKLLRDPRWVTRFSHSFVGSFEPSSAATPRHPSSSLPTAMVPWNRRRHQPESPHAHRWELARRRQFHLTSALVRCRSRRDPPVASRIAELARSRLPVAAAPGAVAGACRDLLLDDLEDGDEQTSGAPGASGSWRSFKYGRHNDEPDDVRARRRGLRGSKHAAHLTGKTGTAFANWAGFEHEAQGGKPHDLSPWAILGPLLDEPGVARLLCNIENGHTSDYGEIRG
jgi:hypothetical protein